MPPKRSKRVRLCIINAEDKYIACASILLSYITEMASQLRIVLGTWLLLYILMEDANPVLAKKKGGLKKLKERVKKLEKMIMGGEFKCERE